MTYYNTQTACHKIPQISSRSHATLTTFLLTICPLMSQIPPVTYINITANIKRRSVFSEVKMKKQVLRCVQARELSVNVLTVEIPEIIVKQLNLILHFCAE